VSVYQATADIRRDDALGGGTWRLFGLTTLTVLFGKNGSGKSLLLRRWRESDATCVHYVAPERMGGLGFNPSYMQQQLEGQGRMQTSTRNFIPEYRQQVISRIQGYFLARGGFRGEKLPGDPRELEQFLAELIPDFVLTVEPKNEPLQIVRRSSNSIVGDVDQLSSGEAQLITVAVDVLTIAAIWELEGRATRLLLVDEPDAHIHSDLQVRFADFLIRVAKRFSLQVVVATHSTTLLSALGQFGGSDTSLIYLDRRQNELRAAPFDDALREVTACLGGHILMGPLFGAPILLVEGDDDYRIWSQAPRHHVIRLAVIPSNGQEIYRYQRALERVLGSVSSSPREAGYALLDADKPLPTPTPQNSQDYIRFMRLACHESENLFLTDEVLADLGTDWPAAMTSVAAVAVQYGNKTPLLQSVATWDRKTHDVKAVVNELSNILDSKKVHWTTRIGTAIGRNKPTGQLADFLGQSVMNAIWPS
jgi:hypothetical protein